MLLEDLGFLDFGSCFQRTKGFWILAHVFRGPRIFELWLMFSKDQRFWILAHVFRRLRVFWILAHVFRGLRVF